LHFNQSGERVGGESGRDEEGREKGRDRRNWESASLEGLWERKRGKWEKMFGVKRRRKSFKKRLGGWEEKEFKGLK